MTSVDALDFEPVARQVYDDFLVSLPDVPVEGLFRDRGRYFIVSPSLDMVVREGRTVADWFERERKPLGHPIFLVAKRPEGTEELPSRTADEVRSGFGVVRTRHDIRRDLALRLPVEFPLASVLVEGRVLVVVVSRPLAGEERSQLDEVVAGTGDPLPLEVRVDERPSPTEAAAPGELAVRAMRLELAPSRHQPNLPKLVRSFVEEDEAFWRDNFDRVLRGDSAVEQILGPDRRSLSGDACLVSTTFDPGNIRSYLSLYKRVVLVMPLEGRVASVLTALGVTRAELIELVDRKKVVFVAPQSCERYDASFLAEIAEVSTTAVTGSRRLAAAVLADQCAHNPLLVFPGTALDRRTVLRALRRVASLVPGPKLVLDALVEGLTNAWPLYENTLHSSGAMASLSGPLAEVGRALAKRLTGNDLFIELGVSAQNVEWSAAFGAHVSPFEGDGYSEVGHCELLAAIQSGVPRGASAVVPASRFEVAEELLVIDSKVDIIDFVTSLGEGDLARFRDLIPSIARPGRSAEEVSEVVAMWNRQGVRLHCGGVKLRDFASFVEFPT